MRLLECNSEITKRSGLRAVLVALVLKSALMIAAFIPGVFGRMPGRFQMVQPASSCLSRSPTRPGPSRRDNGRCQTARMLRSNQRSVKTAASCLEYVFGLRRRASGTSFPGAYEGKRAADGSFTDLGREQGSDMSVINLKVNGRSHTVDVDPATPLLYVLSDDLELRGPKFGCGLGQCGSCTVIVKGQAIRSCVTPVASVAGSEITTLEGLGTRREAASDSAGVHRRAGDAVRLLRQRRHHDRQGVSRSEPESGGRRDPAGDVRRAVPLRRATSG